MGDWFNNVKEKLGQANGRRAAGKKRKKGGQEQGGL